jgi:hypothetical protein
MESFFLAHPKESYNLEGLMRVFTDANEGTVRMYMSELGKRKSSLQGAVIIKDSYGRGFWTLNPSYRTVDQLRGAVIDHITENQRVYQSDEKFSPTEPPIKDMDNPTLPYRRMFFNSIIERMGKSAQFSQSDVELLKKEAPHLLPSKEGQK